MRNEFFNKNDIQAESYKERLNRSDLKYNNYSAVFELEQAFLNLFFKEHKSFYEIADILNITKAHVRQLKQMALIKIRN